MNLCQPGLSPDGNSPWGCGGCCGLFNIQAGSSHRHRLLLERTQRVGSLLAGTREQSPDRKRPYFFEKAREFRLDQEKREANRFQLADPHTYSCVFLGYLDSPPESITGDSRGFGRLGCLIHPARTEIEGSQNASFYGASICQTYDCPAKERTGWGPENQAAPWGEFFRDLTRDNHWLRQIRRRGQNTLGIREVFTALTTFWPLPRLLPKILGVNAGQLLAPRAPAMAIARGRGEKPAWRHYDLLAKIFQHRLDPLRVDPALFTLTSFEIWEINGNWEKPEAENQLANFLAGQDGAKQEFWLSVFARARKSFQNLPQD